jgi:hypothetical protein
MSPMLVLRVEHQDTREGPWSCRTFHGSCLHANCLPTPGADDLPFSLWPQSTGPKLYAIPFLEDRFTYYFNLKDRQILTDGGFVLSTYMLPPGTFSVGNVQVIFAIDEGAQRVHQQSLLDQTISPERTSE